MFLKLGTLSFGGPAAHIAMMEAEIVRRRGWLTPEAFVDYLGVTNMIPGPNSTEMAIHVGRMRAGRAGLVVAGACFILPAALLVTAIASAYVRFGTLPAAESVLYGVKPVVIAVVVQALWRLSRTVVKRWGLALLGAGAIVAAAFGVNELVILAAGGVAAVALAAASSGSERPPAAAGVTAIGGPAAPLLSLGAAAAVPFGLWPLFAVFFKIGAVLFGSGYVLLAFLRADFVERLGWLSERQLLDAVAVGQITPGPVFTSATFIGYVLGGGAGALVATAGIFLPAFVYVAVSGPLVARLRRSRRAGAALDGVNVASLALMAVVSWQLGRSALVDPLTAVLALGAAVALVRFDVNSVWLILAGGLVGLAAGLV